MIKDGSLPNNELRSELAALRQRVAELENDMEDRRVVEEALKESEERFRLIFDELGDGLLVADKETKKFVMGNATIHRMLGYTAEELCRIGIADIHPEQDLPWVIDRFGELARKEIQIARNIPVRRKSGSVFYADISSSFPIVLNKKKCLLGVFRDITERRQAEEAVRESQALLSATIESMPFEFWAIGRGWPLYPCKRAMHKALRGYPGKEAGGDLPKPGGSVHMGGQQPQGLSGASSSRVR